jgi:hypothetical protein
MDHGWGRQASAGTWISTRPVWALSAALIAVVSVIGLGQYRYSRGAPLQRFYFPAYVRSTILDAQGRSQLAKRYGLDSEAMLSQPATKIFSTTVVSTRSFVPSSRPRVTAPRG